MMQDIEKLFRESLSNAELPYEAGAWEAMSAKLGPPKAPSSGAKWYIAAAAVTVVAGIATFATLNTEKQPAKKDTPAPVATTVAAKPESTAENHAQPARSAETAAADRSRDNVTASPVVPSAVTAELPAVQTTTGPASTPGSGSLTPPEADETKNAAAPAKLLPVSIPAHICSNETVIIFNPNASDLWVKLPGEDAKALKGKQKASFTVSKAGDIIINNGELTQKITVSQAASADITGNEQVLYENGVPQMTFTTSVKLENAVWSANAPGNETKEGFVVHPYHNEEVTVKISGTDFNGCKVQEERTIPVPESYNLLAPGAFRPEGSISANQFFMPFALMQRDTPFELFVFDPKNSAQVFSTRDASKGWDGHDSRNGELVPVNTVWVWKVILKNPLPGETPVYSGTITRL